MEKLGSCRKFSGYPRENGAKFLREFESFSTLHELDEDDEARKLAAFHLHLQGPALTWYNNLDPEIDWQNLRDQFMDKYVNIGWQHPSVIVESETFQNMVLGPQQDIEDFYCQILEKGQLLNKQDQEIMLKFINGLPDKLAFYVRSSKPQDIAEALSLAKAGEAYKYRVHVESVAAVKPANNDVSDLKRQVGELTTMVQRLSCEQPKQFSPNYNRSGIKSQGPPRSSIFCHNCNSQGHIKKYCNWNGQGNVSPHLSCQLCSQNGHSALQCCKFNNQNPQNSGVICQICSKFGHSASRCFQLHAGPRVQPNTENFKPLKDIGHDPSGN